MPFCAEAQGIVSRVDSLYNEVASATRRDTQYVKTLCAFANAINVYQADSTLIIARQALVLADSLQFPAGKSEAHRIIAFASQRLGKMAQSLRHYRLALPTFAAQGDTLGLAECYNGLGIVYLEQGNFYRAIDYYHRTLAVIQSAHFKTAAMRSRYVFTLSNLGYVHAVINALDSAEHYVRRADDSCKRLRFVVPIPFILANYAEIARRRGYNQRAVEYAERALQEALRQNNRFVESRAYTILGTIAMVEHRYADAERYLQDALRIASKATLLLRTKEIYERLENLALTQRDFERAYLYSHKREWYRDILADESSVMKIADMEEALNRERIEGLERENHQQRWIVIIAVSGSVLLLVLVVWLMNLRRLQVRANALLREQNAEIVRQKVALEEQTKEITAMNRQLQEQNTALDNANRLKMQMLSIASHDIRSPLTKIISYAEVLILRSNKGQGISAEGKTFAERIIESAWQVLTMVKDFLDTAAQELSAIELHWTTMDMSATLRHSVEAWSLQLHQKRQHIHVQSPDECWLCADPDRVRQVIDNILSNAIKYSPFDATVAVSLSCETDMVRLTVRDEGVGLTEQDKHQMFGFFQRLSATPTGGESSSGVGLAIVKHIVELHGGRVWAESERDQGKSGTTFIVELPRTKPSDTPTKS